MVQASAIIAVDFGWLFVSLYVTEPMYIGEWDGVCRFGRKRCVCPKMHHPKKTSWDDHDFPH